MSKISKSIISILLLYIYISVSSATINNYLAPTCINPGYDANRPLLINSYTSGTNGNISVSDVSSGGFFTPQESRVVYTQSVTCAISDPSTIGTVPPQHRVFGITSGGVVFYVDNPSEEFTGGFYDLGTFGISCSGAGGNCNEIFVVANLTPTAQDIIRKIGFDSNGNLYIQDGTTLSKLTKANNYAPAVFFQFSGQTFGTTFQSITDVQTDASGNVYALVTSFGGATCGAIGYCLELDVISPAGSLTTHTRLVGHAGSRSINLTQGGLVLDLTNPTQNFTYAYRDIDAGMINVTHNSSSGNTNIALVPFATIADVNDIHVKDGILYISSRSQNKIFAYTTNFTEFEVEAVGGTGIAELVYTTQIIDTQFSTYYNNSDFNLYYKVELDKLDNSLFSSFGNYKYKVVLYDPNGVQLDGAVHFGPNLVCGFLSCAINETLTYPAPSTGWQNGSWYARLYEYNTETYQTALIGTSSTWTVLNQSFNGTINPPTPDINSGTGSEALSAIDGWTAMFGLGVNQVSKFLFAMFIIVVFMIIGLILTKMSFTGAVVFGILPYCFFIYITYLPLWTVVIFGIVIAMKIGIFR